MDATVPGFEILQAISVYAVEAQYTSSSGFSSFRAKPHVSSLFSSVQYVLPLLCTGELDIATSIAFSMAVPTNFCRKCVTACVWM